MGPIVISPYISNRHSLEAQNIQAPFNPVPPINGNMMSLNEYIGHQIETQHPTYPQATVLNNMPNMAMPQMIAG